MEQTENNLDQHPKYISVSIASEKWGIPRRTLLYWIKQGHLVAKKVGTQWVIPSKTRKPDGLR